MDIDGINITGNGIAGTSGLVVQVVYVERTDSPTGIGNIPFDDTIPDIVEGLAVLSGIITPKFATSRLIVEAQAYAGEETNVEDAVAMAIFRDTTSGAIACTFQQQYAAGSEPFGSSIVFSPLYLSKMVNANSTATTTFQLRVGLNGATNTFPVRLNGNNGTRRFGGALTTFLKITEIS